MHFALIYGFSECLYFCCWNVEQFHVSQGQISFKLHPAPLHHHTKFAYNHWLKWLKYCWKAVKPQNVTKIEKKQTFDVIS